MRTRLLALIVLLAFMPVLYGAGEFYKYNASDIVAKSPWVDVRTFGAVPNAGSSVDQWSAFDNAIKYANDNFLPIYIPPGEYYFSTTVYFSAHTSGAAYTTPHVYGGVANIQDQNWGVVLRPMASFVGGTSGKPIPLVRVDSTRNLIIKNISLKGNYQSDSKYISGFGVGNYNNRAKISFLSVWDFYTGVHHGCGEYDGNNDEFIYENILTNNVDYGFVTSTTQAYLNKIDTSRLSARKLAFSDTALTPVAGNAGGSWTLINCFININQPNDNTYWAKHIEVTPGYNHITLIGCHIGAETSGTNYWMPGVIISAGSGYPFFTMRSCIINLGEFSSSIADSDHPQIRFGPSASGFIEDTYINSQSDFYISSNDSVPSIVKNTFFTFGTSGKTLKYTNLKAFKFISSYISNTADGTNIALNDYGITSSVGTYQGPRMGIFDNPTTNCPGNGCGNDNTTNTNNWETGSFVFRKTPSRDGNSLWIGEQSDSGTWHKVYGSTTPIMRSAPADNTTACTAGTLAWDASYIYVCTTDNNWKRTGLSTY